jgi:hypothetical protein
LIDRNPDLNELDIHATVTLVASGEKETAHYFYNCHAPSGCLKIQKEGTSVRVTLDEGQDWDSWILYDVEDIPALPFIEDDLKNVFFEYIERDVVWGSGLNAPVRTVDRRPHWRREKENNDVEKAAVGSK